MNRLQSELRRIDHRGYPAYKDLRGSYDFGKYILNIITGMTERRLLRILS